MSANTKHPAVQQYTLAMRVLGGLYLLGAIGFLLFPNLTMAVVNLLPRLFEFIEVLPPQEAYFWVPLATSMMVMLTIVAFSAAADPANGLLAVIHMAAKFTSSGGYLFMLLTHHPDEGGIFFGYLLGCALDLAIAVGVLVLAMRVRAHHGAPAETDEHE